MPVCGTIFFEDQSNLHLAFLELAFIRLCCAGKNEARIEEHRQWLVETNNQRRFNHIRTRIIPQWYRVAKVQTADVLILHRKRQIQQYLQLQIEVGMMAARDCSDLRQILNLHRSSDCIGHGVKKDTRNIWTCRSNREKNGEKRTQHITLIQTWGRWFTRCARNNSSTIWRSQCVFERTLVTPLRDTAPSWQFHYSDNQGQTNISPSLIYKLNVMMKNIRFTSVSQQEVNDNSHSYHDDHTRFECNIRMPPRTKDPQ